MSALHDPIRKPLDGPDRLWMPRSWVPKVQLKYLSR
jgi:hypothetical protein